MEWGVREKEKSDLSSVREINKCVYEGVKK